MKSLCAVAGGPDEPKSFFLSFFLSCGLNAEPSKGIFPYNVFGGARGWARSGLKVGLVGLRWACGGLGELLGGLGGLLMGLVGF